MITLETVHTNRFFFIGLLFSVQHCPKIICITSFLTYKMGLQLNEAKCEVVSSHAAAVASLQNLITLHGCSVGASRGTRRACSRRRQAISPLLLLPRLPPRALRRPGRGRVRRRTAGLRVRPLRRRVLRPAWA